MSSELISVIVPVYNVEKYIDKCIGSLLNQTYKNLEIFLVDDGSTDSSSGICDRYALSDPRIKVIHKENGGQSDARNVALDLISGEYVLFVDSDDFVESEYIEFLYALLKSCDADISICSSKFLNENYEVLKKKVWKFEKKELNNREALFELLHTKYFSCEPWDKLFKSSLFEDIRFPKGKIFEDLGTVYKVFLKSSKVVFGNKAYYNYLCRNGSTMNDTFRISRLQSAYFVEEMVQVVTEKYPDLKKMGDCRRFTTYVGLLRLVDKHKYPDIYSEMWIKIKKYRKTVLIYKYARLKQKIYALASLLGSGILKRTLKLI